MPRQLGQHFLKDKKILTRIAHEALEGSHGMVVEIGPGHGELTDTLLTKGATKIIAIEKDAKLVEQLNHSLVPRADGKLKIIHGDVRIVLLKLINQSTNQLRNYTVVGNIPYYLTGYLFRLLADLTPPPKRVVLMVQREVAERACATAPHMNLLSAMIHGWAMPEIAFTVPRTAFVPPPKVESALLLLAPHHEIGERDRTQYFEVVKKAFRQPRKTLANNLREGFLLSRERAEELVKTLGLPSDARGAALTPQHVRILAKMMYN